MKPSLLIGLGMFIVIVLGSITLNGLQWAGIVVNKDKLVVNTYFCEEIGVKIQQNVNTTPVVGKRSDRETVANTIR
jgi:hypothetical protein